MSGSSPLTRGKHTGAPQPVHVEGLIPAHAGKTRPRPDSRRVRRAHPRSRGENLKCGFVAVAVLGSSPLTRGKPHPGRPPRDRRRLIPAHAGKTHGRSQRHLHVGAHPRSRGENSRVSPSPESVPGSSPLTRGKPDQDAKLTHIERLIPAHAGKTTTTRATRSRSKAHPRSRGENYGVEIELFDGYGSSPLTRGKPCARLEQDGDRRLIPAHAGKTQPATRCSSTSRAHPRSRGENQAPPAPVWEPPGSSPLTRGKPGTGSTARRTGGLIPAHAGKTVPGVRRLIVRRAHPRSRGENRANSPAA